MKKNNIGIIINIVGRKTRVVSTYYRKKNIKYNIIFYKLRKVLVHDSLDCSKVGNIVTFTSVRPLSKNKQHIIKSILC